jgi:Kef-type K+ transport system membrane component KefB
MTLSTSSFALLLLDLALLLTSAHAFGYLFVRLRQPRVIGEIVGGLVLGPTLFGLVLPELQQRVFPTTGEVPLVLDAVYQLGLLLLMFSSGAEMRPTFGRGERRTISFVGVTGTAFPLLAGVAAVAWLGSGDLMGPAGTDASFTLVFGIAVAVTSIPVISRIMHDLGILETGFARIVLGVAVLEDVLLYVLLAIALGLVARTPSDLFGLPSLLGLDPVSAWNVAYHVVATVAFLGIALWAGPSVYRRVLRFRFNFVKRSSAIGFQLAFMLAFTLAAIFLGIVPLFGAFMAGVVAGSVSGDRAAEAREAIKSFSFAFFIPVYFAIVGLRLDLVRHFAVTFFVPFFVFACVVKASSVYLGARLAGQPGRGAFNLAVALNARGGPGIVLASVALDAMIIGRDFYASLVMLAILTSLLAGSWLERAVRRGELLEGTAEAVAPGG